MPDYIADVLHTVRRSRVPPAARGFSDSSLGRHVEALRDEATSLDARELYAFDLSALNAAADLRIDTPDRVDRLVTAVLADPRRLFIEADDGHLNAIAGGLRGFLDADPGVVRETGRRWGVFIDILGDGRAVFRSVSLMPAGWFKEPADLSDLASELRGLPASAADLAKLALRAVPGAVEADLDISRHVGMSRTEFERAAERISDAHDPLARRMKLLLSQSSGVRERKRILDEAWRATRFRDVVRERRIAPREQESSLGARLAAHPACRRDVLRDGLCLIAMLAVLQADSSDLRKAPRERRSRDKSKGRAATPSRPKEQAPGVSVVTLNLEDRDLQQIYETGGATEAADHSTQSAGGGRVRHPVRGHLFLARNGQLTWRKPHWRGALERPTIKRLVAPSHRR